MKVVAAIFSKGPKDSLGESFVSADISGTEKLTIFRHIPKNILIDIRLNIYYNHANQMGMKKPPM